MDINISIRDLNEVVENFSKRLKSNWQVFFLTMIIMYSASLYHALKINPPLKLSGYTQNLDLISFVFAIILTVLIFNLKRKYFSKKFSRNITKNSLKNSPDLSDIEILKIIFGYLQKKLYIIWSLGFLIVLDGLIVYGTIHLSRNMHIYFVVGTFSLILNYPRIILFEEIPIYIREARKNTV
jgi:hypothetical protein